MTDKQSSTTIRVRYSETDQLGTFYNSRALEWFEVARTEWLRDAGHPYTECEDRGAFLPLVESHVEYKGRARYDDQLELLTTAQMTGKARARFDITITNTESNSVIACGYTVHAITNQAGKPIRPEPWFTEMFE